MINQEIAKIFREMVRLLEIKGEKNVFRINSYLKAAGALEKFSGEIADLKDIKNIQKSFGVGEKIAKKISEYLKNGKIKDYAKLEKDTIIQQIITYYFETKGLSLIELKQNARKKRIVYSRFTKPAKELLELAGSVEKAKEAIKKVAEWASSRNLDYAIETVFKKWLELDRLKPKEVVKKPFFRGNPMIWSSAKNKWYVIAPEGDWLEFAGKEAEIDWRVIK